MVVFDPPTRISIFKSIQEIAYFILFLSKGLTFPSYSLTGPLTSK